MELTFVLFFGREGVELFLPIYAHFIWRGPFPCNTPILPCRS